MDQNEPQIMMIENGNGKKVKKIILDEDLFVDQLDRIIERDFFPDLKKLKLNQQLNNDKDSTKLKSNNEDDKQIKIDDNITLGQFLNKFTSEDNASFNEIIEATNKRHQEKYPWFNLDENKIKQQIENNLSIDNQQINNKEDDKMITWTYKNKNAIMFNPEGCQLTTKELLEERSKNKQTIAIENTRFRKAPFRKITYKLNTNQTDTSNATTTNSNSTINTPNQTNYIQSKYNPSGDLVNLERKEYKLIESTPLIEPNETDDMFTWGEIESTPIRLNEEDSISTPSSGRFKIPALSAREQAAIKLTDSFSKSKKQKLTHSNQKLWTPSPSNLLSTPRTPRLDQLSPAVQQFAQSKLRLNIKNDLKSISINRFSGKTPSPSIKSSSLSSFIKSPSLNKINNTPINTSITDNLLNLSKND